MDIQAVIKQQVTENPVVLYMKGTPTFPQCGFPPAPWPCSKPVA